MQFINKMINAVTYSV